MSRRIYITLNEKKDKDKVILDYLSSSYSESDTIKDVLYRIATNSYNLSLNLIEEIDTKGANRCEKVMEASKVEDSEKMQEIPISSDIASMF
ncbi:MAG: hypothetical protein PUJ51_13415 [Clostridiales bacterium]|uniref:hypothetical protein n=1 Tax=Terrisporobacter sp. TaxID=1965305 RepID=UPI002A55749D|nr:hypothetical protein [Terrisporobacter sp.]MCI6458657.1 hypothetical protein [Clostridium sp.]MDD7755484.1 hypothetical protein [Clostridiales bacterium]MDY4137215.1 hypothetical protein [Terrisporobacter sp.]MDY4736168.1 hypothetical protein [Terrisporobacter sp.]